MTTIKVKGMSCNHCVMAVTKALNAIEGVADVEVSLEKGEAYFTEVRPVNVAVVKEKIKKVGYDVD